ncbi:HU family DNA-binding protein (plasmid) [Paenibacillus sp. EC2-1]|uniref:HU family DNA-binding protein n=1 Tax=Paenibacillus sp. EC2-1 TaxID=3388665 RepID=UPI003BEF3CCE
MSKTIIVKNLQETGLSEKQASAALETVLKTIKTETAEKGKFPIKGFGTFEKRVRAARKGRNPQTGEEIDIAESNNVGFKAGKEFKEEL